VSKQAGGSGSRVGPEVNLARGGWKKMSGNLHRIGNHTDGFTYLIDPMASMFIRRATPIHIYSTQKTVHRRKGQGSEKGRESAGSEGNVGRIGRNQMSGIVIRPRNHAHRFTYLARLIASKSSAGQSPHTLKPNDRPSKPPTHNNQYGRESKPTKSTLRVSVRSKSLVW
jgi:hypothetical protein